MPTIKRYFGKMFHGQLHIFQEEIEKGKRKPAHRPPPPKIPQEEEEEKASQWSKKSQSPKSDLPSTPTSTSTETAQEREAQAHTALEKIMKEYFKRLKTHSGIEFSIIVPILAFFAGGANERIYINGHQAECWQGGLIMMTLTGIICWSVVLITNFKRK